MQPIAYESEGTKATRMCVQITMSKDMKYLKPGLCNTEGLRRVVRSSFTLETRIHFSIAFVMRGSECEEGRSRAD